MKSKRILILRVAIIVICLLWQGVIYGFSAENSDESGGRSQGICEKIAIFLTRGDDDITEAEIAALADRIEPPLRSLAHMFCYAVLGGLYFVLFASFGASGMRLCCYSVGCTVIYAVLDEMHQHFVPGRSMQFVDIVVDTIGAMLAVCTLSLIFHTVRKRRKRNENSYPR